MASPAQTLNTMAKSSWSGPCLLLQPCYLLSIPNNSQDLKEATLSSESRPCMCHSLFWNTSPHHTHTPSTPHLCLSGIFFSLTLSLSLDNSSFRKFSQMFQPGMEYWGCTYLYRLVWWIVRNREPGCSEGMRPGPHPLSCGHLHGEAAAWWTRTSPSWSQRKVAGGHLRYCEGNPPASLSQVQMGKLSPGWYLLFMVKSSDSEIKILRFKSLLHHLQSF